MWKLIGQSNNPWLYSDSRRDFYGCEDIKANVAWERLINVMKVKKKICLFYKVVNDELWKDYL